MRTSSVRRRSGHRSVRVVRDWTEPSSLAGLRLALYVRASKDRGHDEVSVEDQEDVGLAWGARRSCVHVGTYLDNDRSASRYATKAREEFIRLVADIEAGRIDVVWFWELTRQQRRLDEYAALRDLCRDRGMPWVVRDQVYDLNNVMHLGMLGFSAVHGELESELMSDRVRRGVAGAASRGRPPGPLAYGYRRWSEDGTRATVRQEPDERPRQAVAADGSVSEYTTAGIVRTIFDRLATGGTLDGLAHDFNQRGIPAAKGGGWVRSTVRGIATNPAYIGRRVHNGEILEGVKTLWPALIDADVFWAVNAKLGAPERRTSRDGRARHLLSLIARCDMCSAGLQVEIRHNKNGAERFYRCSGRSRCVGVNACDLEEYVTDVIVGWLSNPTTGAALGMFEGNDRELADARARRAELHTELEQLYADAEAGTAGSPTLIARRESGLLRRIAEQDDRLTTARVPLPLRGITGPDAERVWPTLDIAARREILRAIAEVRVKPHPAGKGRHRPGFTPDRVHVRFLLGDEPPTET